MKTVGFLISHKNNEKRRAILPEDLVCINRPENMYFEKGYGECLGIKVSVKVKMGMVSMILEWELHMPILLCIKKL